MAESITNSSDPSRRSWLVLALVVAAHCAFNLLVNPLGFNFIGPFEWLKTLLLAVMFAQPVLFAEWAVLGPGATVWRVPLTIVAAAGVALCGFYAGWNLFSGTRVPPWNDIDYLYFWSGAFLLAAIVLILVRRVTHWRLIRLAELSSSCVPVNQFSVKYLLVLTAVCAAVLGAAHTMASQHWPGLSASGTSDVVRTLIRMSLAILAIFPTVTVPLIALTRRPTIKMLISVPLAWAALSWLALETVIATNLTEDRSKVALDMALLQIGTTLTGFLTAFVVRLAGHRLWSGNLPEPLPLVPVA